MIIGRKPPPLPEVGQHLEARVNVATHPTRREQERQFRPSSPLGIGLGAGRFYAERTSARLAAEPDGDEWDASLDT